ncbi:hypothetical protein AGMMS49965_12230 [Bacteroidia bacterium]|nr:hypothetical protein AGMMS49965_12230 [Bacteroidia bacterium]
MFSACASHLLEEQPALPTEQPEEKPWVLDEATIAAMTKNGGLIINWIDTVAKKSVSPRASNDVTIGPGGVPGIVNPTEQERQQQIWQEKWNDLKRDMEPLPYIYRKAADLTVDYETNGVKVIYDWWWFDEADKMWKMKPTHEAAGVKLVVDRYWNSTSTDGWQHAVGGIASDNTLKDIAKWQSPSAAKTRLAGYKTLYQEIDRFRYDYVPYLQTNQLFFSGSMEETLMLDDADPQKAPTLLLYDMDTYLRSNYVGVGEDRVIINEGVYANSNDISEVYPPRPNGYSKTDSVIQINKYGKFLDAEKMLESPIYVLQQDATLPSSHPELPRPKYSAPAAARGKLFEFYMGNVKVVDPSWWGGEEDAVIILDDLDIYVGEAKQVVIRTIPSDISLAGIEWQSSNTSIVSITANGLAIGEAIGEATISVIFEDRELASCKVRVTIDPNAIPATHITLDKTELEMYPGEVYDRLIASVTPPDATYRTVVWVSDDETIATVDTDGRVTAVGVGTTYIIARAGGRMDECKVTVSFPSIVLEDIVVHKGRTALVKYTTSPPGTALVNAVWESEITEIATVLAGAVTGVEEGETIITVTSNGKFAGCKVTVLPPHPDDVMDIKSVAIYDANYNPKTHSGGKELKKLALPLKETYQLQAVISPAGAVCDVVWVSETPDIATVDQSGVVTAVKEGKANIMVIANGLTAACEVSVEMVIVTPATLTIKIGETTPTPPTTTITPYYDPYETPFWWSENPSIAYVDAAGIITGESVGVVKIYATKGGSAYCTVTVKIDVDMAITPKTLALNIGEMYNALAVRLTTTNGIDVAYTFSSENPDIATVDGSGVVVGIAVGTTKIFATTAGGLSDFCTVTVVPPVQNISYPVFDFTMGRPASTVMDGIRWGDPMPTLSWETTSDMTGAAFLGKLEESKKRWGEFVDNIQPKPYYSSVKLRPEYVFINRANTMVLDYSGGEIIINRYWSHWSAAPENRAEWTAALARRQMAYKSMVKQIQIWMEQMQASPLWNFPAAISTPIRELNAAMEELIAYPTPLTDDRLKDRLEISVDYTSRPNIDHFPAYLPPQVTGTLFEYYFGYIPPPPPMPVIVFYWDGEYIASGATVHWGAGSTASLTSKILYLPPGSAYDKLKYEFTPKDEYINSADGSIGFISYNPIGSAGLGQMVDVKLQKLKPTLTGMGTIKATNVNASGDAPTAANLRADATINISVKSTLTPVESAAFSSVVGNHTLTITLTGGTFAPAASLVLSRFSLTTPGTPGFTTLNGGRVTRISDTQVIITNLPAVTRAGSGQKITIADGALATQATAATATATVVASGVNPVESAPFSSVVSNDRLTITLTGGSFAPESSLSLSQFTLTTPGTPGFASPFIGTLTRISDTQVTITNLPAVTRTGSGQKITIAGTALATQAVAVTVVASTTKAIESAAFSSIVGNHTLTITLTGGTFAPASSLSLSQFTLTTRGTPGVVSLDGGILRRASSTECTIIGLDLVKIAGEGQTITIHGAAFATLTQPSIVRVVARGAPRDPSSQDLTIKFGIRRASEVLTQSIVYETYTALHNMISHPAPNEDFSTFVQLGDYIDLPSLTYGNNTIVDKGLRRGRLLRHIVVGINSFKHDIPGAVSIIANNPGAPDHVVFQFQNAPLNRNMNSTVTNDGGYYQSEMRQFLTNSFYPGLKEAAGGITDEMFWTPSRKLLLPTREGGNSADILWLPTISEITGRDEWYPLHTTLQEEAKLPMARLEYYTNNDRRIKYDKDNRQGDYWLSTPLIVNPDGERFPEDLWPGPPLAPGLGWLYYWDLDRYNSCFCTIRSDYTLREYHGEEYDEQHWKEAYHAFATHAVRDLGCAPAFCIR